MNSLKNVLVFYKTKMYYLLHSSLIVLLFRKISAGIEIRFITILLLFQNFSSQFCSFTKIRISCNLYFLCKKFSKRIYRFCTLFIYFALSNYKLIKKYIISSWCFMWFYLLMEEYNKNIQRYTHSSLRVVVYIYLYIECTCIVSMNAW